MEVRPQRKPILLLNGDRYTALAKVSFQKAIKLILQGKAISIAPRQDVQVQGPIRPDGTRFTMDWPVAIMLKQYVHIKYDDIAPTEDTLAPRMAILHRDHFTCQFMNYMKLIECEDGELEYVRATPNDPEGEWVACNKAADTIDHVQPQSRGGENTWWNLVAADQPCNSYKADRTPDEANMRLVREPFAPARKNYKADRHQQDVWKLLESGALDDIE